MERKFKTHWNFKLEKAHMEETSGPSLTQPDETVSLKELVTKHVKGLRVDDSLYRESQFDSGAGFDSVDLEKINAMDLHERELLLDQLRQSIEASKKRVAEYQEAAKKAAEKESDLDDERTGDGSDSEPVEPGSNQARRPKGAKPGSAQAKPGAKADSDPAAT